MHEAFIDLDELIVRCRDKLSKKFIQEAVACYRAGAFRSCIVATWNAVVFDFLHKLRELELFEDKQATELLAKFDGLRSPNPNFKELWQFESNIPDIALTKFELISPVEKSDIERLFEDRSRCAHPSMTSLEEPFEATAELARYHLRSAVTHLLERPPVQGRAASKRIFEDIKSEYFPVELESAIMYIQKSPLARARAGLIKDIVIGLTKSLLIESHPEDKRLRQFSALNAILNVHHKETKEILNNQLSKIIINRVIDENWDKVIIYLGSIEAWDSLSEPCQIKAKFYIDKIEVFSVKTKSSFKQLSEQAISILVKASRIPFLSDAVSKKFNIPVKYLLSLKETCKDDIFKDRILIPVLRDLSSQATLDELLSMRAEDLLKSDEKIQAEIKEKIRVSSLNTLISIIVSKSQDKWLIDIIDSNLEEKISTASLKDLLKSKSKYKSIEEPRNQVIELFDNHIDKRFKEDVQIVYLKEEIVPLIEDYYEDDSFIVLVESYLQEKISTADLENLLEVKIAYKLIGTPKAEIIKLFEDSITQLFKDSMISENPKISFDDLLKLLENKSYRDEISDELLKPLVKINISAILDKFARSANFNSAASNTRLLVEVAEYLNPTQWEDMLLNAFFQNDQIHGSYSCIRTFELLFKKSLEISGFVQPYWLSFRDKLNRFNGQDINNLKRLIDSHSM